MTYLYCPQCATPLERRVVGERERDACPACDFIHWHNPLPVLAAIVEVEGQILLARNAAWPAKTFALIAGFLEHGETPEQGIARELKEETNLDAQRIALVGVYDFIRKNEIIIAYHVEASGEIRLSEELAEYRTVSLEKLRPWRGGTGYALADWMTSRGLPFTFIDSPLS